jgi:hypothetical protein
VDVCLVGLVKDRPALFICADDNAIMVLGCVDTFVLTVYCTYTMAKKGRARTDEQAAMPAQWFPIKKIFILGNHKIA